VLRVLKAESNLSETTDRAAALLEELRARLKIEPAPPPQETPDDLDRELRAYFSASVLDDIRDRVVQGVVDRIMRAWEEPAAKGSGGGAMEEAVVNRLIDRVLERLGKDSTAQTAPVPGPR
jgi:hypothetical protein